MKKATTAGVVPRHQRGVTTDGERGLLSIAFDPDYARNTPLLRLLHEPPTETSRSTRFQRRPTRAPARRRRSGDRDPAPGRANHNGGKLQFGPDGDLYRATGDGGGAGDPHENAQNRARLLGKLLRIDPQAQEATYSVPRAIPSSASPAATRSTRSACATRSGSPSTADAIVIGDVGQDQLGGGRLRSPQRLRGANFGWDHFEGDHRFDFPGDNEAPRPKLATARRSSSTRTTPPTAVRRCAIIGGVRGPRPHAAAASAGATSTPTSTRASFAASSRIAAARRHDRALGVHVDHPSSFGVGAQPPRLRDLARRPGLPARFAGSEPASAGRVRSGMERATARPAAPAPASRQRSLRRRPGHRGPQAGRRLAHPPGSRRPARARRRGRRPRPRRAARVGGDRVRRTPPLARAAFATG